MPQGLLTGGAWCNRAAHLPEEGPGGMASSHRLLQLPPQGSVCP